MRLKFLHPITITAANKTIRWLEDAFVLTTSIAEGTYWAYTGTLLTGYPRLWDAIAAAMTAESGSGGLGNTYSVSAATPTESAEQVGAGLAITSDLSSTTWEWDASGTINTDGLCGWLKTSSPSYTLDNAGVVTSPLTYGGAWIPPWHASEWRREPVELVAFSTRYTDRADAYVISSGSRSRRVLVIEDLAAAHVLESRGLLAPYADAAGLGEGDVANAFETLWRAMLSLESIVCVFYDTDGDVDGTIPADAYEIQRLAEPLTGEWGDAARLTRRAGEWYTCAWKVWRVSGGMAQ